MSKSIVPFLELNDDLKDESSLVGLTQVSEYREVILAAKEHIEALEEQVAYYQNQAACCSCRKLAEKVAA